MGGLERGLGSANNSAIADQHFVKLRGLPYSATEQQIAQFFGPSQSEPRPLQVVAVQVAFKETGQPSGFGFVQFRTPDDATSALTRSGQVLGSRYVEVFRTTRAEMEQAHMQAMAVSPMRQHAAMAYAQMQGGMGGPQ